MLTLTAGLNFAPPVWGYETSSMSQFWATLIGVLVGGGLAILGQWRVQSQAAKNDRQNQWLRFQRETVAGVQEALSDMWRCFIVANPNNTAPLPVLPPDIPDDEARALVKASVHRTRLTDAALADEVKKWMTDMTAAIDERPVTPEERKALLERYRSMTVRLGSTVRDLHDPAVDSSRAQHVTQQQPAAAK